MNINKSTERFTNKAFSNFSQVYTEVDIIVPDVKPDIARVLQATSNAVITDKSFDNERIIFEGIAHINVLYLSEVGSVRCITTRHNFRHAVDCRGTMSGAIDYELQTQSVEVAMVNSRKICAKILMGLETTICQEQEIEFVNGFEGQNIQENRVRLTASSNKLAAEADLLARETVEVPVGKPCVNEVLRVDSRVASSDCKLAGNKALVKGDIAVCTLYLGDDETLCIMEHTLQFSEIVTLDDEISPHSEAKVEFGVSGVAHNIQQDADGDQRLLSLEVGLKAQVRAECKVDLEVLSDSYALDRELNVKYEKVMLSQANSRAQTSAAVGGTLHLDENYEAISIFSTNAFPKLKSARISDGKVMVEGMLDVCAVALTNSQEMPIIVANKQFDFSAAIDGVEHNLTDGTAVDCKLNLSGFTHSLGLANEVDLRGTVGIEVALSETKEYTYVADIEETECEESTACKPYCLRVYYVKQGDTIWSIAKKYRIKIDDLIEKNGEDIAVGKRLLLQG